MIEPRVWSGQHQPDAMAVEEGQARRSRKEKGQPERVAIKAHRAGLDVVRTHRYLVNAQSPVAGVIASSVGVIVSLGYWRSRNAFGVRY